MRTFIGIDFNKELKNEIFNLQLNMKDFAAKGRWKYIDNFHLTLKFLGDINQAQKNLIDEVLRSICANTAPFSLSIDDLGRFSGKANIRVLWLGLNGDLKQLSQLHQSIDNSLEPLGFKKDTRAYSPHITIGQDIVLKCSFADLKSRLNLKSYPFLVDRLFLFKSDQIDYKRVYTKISEYKFTVT